MATPTYQFTPFGEAKHPWLNKPDVKYHADGLWHVDLRLPLDDPAVQKMKDLVDKAATAGFEELTADLTPGDRKKWSRYVPYEIEEDDQGNPTGFITFAFKQNAVIRLKARGNLPAVEKPIAISLKDMADKEVKTPVFNGAILRVAYSTRAIKQVSNKQAGCRLDFAAAQIKDPGGNRGAGGGGSVSFGTGEGYVQEQDQDHAAAENASAAGAGHDDSPY